MVKEKGLRQTLIMTSIYPSRQKAQQQCLPAHHAVGRHTYAKMSRAGVMSLTTVYLLLNVQSYFQDYAPERQNLKKQTNRKLERETRIVAYGLLYPPLIHLKHWYHKFASSLAIWKSEMHHNELKESLVACRSIYEYKAIILNSKIPYCCI